MYSTLSITLLAFHMVKEGVCEGIWLVMVGTCSWLGMASFLPYNRK